MTTPPTPKHIMLDLETMSTKPAAAICAIGAVEFNPHTLQLGREFYAKVDLTDSVRRGLHMDPETVKWWMGQSDEARKEITFKDEYGEANLFSALTRFHAWVEEVTADFQVPVRVWANGSDFDNVVIRTAFEVCGLEAPWSLRDHRCYRTYKAVYPEVGAPRDLTGVAHNALDDAKYQARHLLRIVEHGGRVA